MRCMWIASFTSTSVFFEVMSMISTPPQSIPWLVLLACSTMVDFLVCFKRHALWCSLIWVLHALFVSPMYTLPQLHGTLYMMLAFSTSGSLSFTRVIVCQRVPCVRNVIQMSYLLVILQISSLQGPSHSPFIVGWRVCYCLRTDVFRRHYKSCPHV